MTKREHRVADTLQRALLPGYLPDVAGLTFHAAYRPATTGLLVGGDYYDAFTLPGGAVCVSICDVSGHGIEAAAAMGKVREAIRIAASTVVSRPHRAAPREPGALSRGSGKVVTAIFGVIDPRAHEFSYASAGHPPALVASHDGNVRVLEGGGLPLGVDEEFTPVVRTATLAAGDTLALYTDGLVENERDLLLGEQRLIGVLRGRTFRCAENPADAIVDEVVSGPQRDDVAVLTVGFEGVAIAPVRRAVPGRSRLGRRRACRARRFHAAQRRTARAHRRRRCRRGRSDRQRGRACVRARRRNRSRARRALRRSRGRRRRRRRRRAARAAVGTGDDHERLEERGRGLVHHPRADTADRSRSDACRDARPFRRRVVSGATRRSARISPARSVTRAADPRAAAPHRRGRR